MVNVISKKANDESLINQYASINFEKSTKLSVTENGELLIVKYQNGGNKLGIVEICKSKINPDPRSINEIIDMECLFDFLNMSHDISIGYLLNSIYNSCKYDSLDELINIIIKEITEVEHEKKFLKIVDGKLNKVKYQSNGKTMEYDRGEWQYISDGLKILLSAEYDDESRTVAQCILDQNNANSIVTGTQINEAIEEVKRTRTKINRYISKDKQ